jgi:hypothetical protein
MRQSSFPLGRCISNLVQIFESRRGHLPTVAPTRSASI